MKQVDLYEGFTVEELEERVEMQTIYGELGEMLEEYSGAGISGEGPGEYPEDEME